MKKIIRTIFLVLLVVPCAFFMVACKDKSNNGDGNSSINLQYAYSTLNSVANKSDYGICAGKTLNIAGSNEYLYEAKLTGNFDEKTKLEYDTIIADIKSDMDSCYESNAILAYNQDGTAILKNKYRDSESTNNQWVEENKYVINKDGTYLLCSVDIYPDIDDSEISFRRVDKNYFIKTFENEDYNDVLRFYNQEFLNVAKTSGDIDTFKSNLNEQIQKFESTIFGNGVYNDISYSVDVTLDKTSQVYTLTFNLIVGDLKFDANPIIAKCNSNLTAKITLKFTSESLLEYSYEAETKINQSTPINSESDSPKLDAIITSTIKSNCVFTNGVDSSLWDSQIEENIPDNLDDVTPVFMSIEVCVNGIMSQSSVTYTFDNIINFDSVKQDMLEYSIKYGFECESSWIKSVKYYLDEAHTMEFSAENITKFPSYDLTLYADIELADNISTIICSYSNDSYTRMVFVPEGEVGLERFSYDDTITKLIINGESVDFSSGKIFVEAGKTYILKLFLEEN